MEQPPEAKPSATPLVGQNVTTGGQPNGGPTRARRYPRPPALLPRLLWLCLRPESWAETARYPTHVTIIPLILAIIISALCVAFGESSRAVATLTQFARSYDAVPYPPLELSADGILRVKPGAPPLNAPIRYEFGNLPVLIDPAGKADPTTLADPQALLVTDKGLTFYTVGRSPVTRTFTEILHYTDNDKSQAITIDGQTMQQFLNENSSGIALGVGVLVFALRFLGEAAWAALVLFLISPLIMLAAAAAPGGDKRPGKRLLLPRRAAHRMAAGLLIPLIILSGVLTGMGHPVSSLLGDSGAMFFWFTASFALAIWTGFMAHRIFAPSASQGRAT